LPSCGKDPSGTLPGSYTITVTGSSGGSITHNTSLMLAVE